MGSKNGGGTVVEEIPIKQVFVVENHRSNIDKTHLDELMISIKQHGLKQPIGVFADGKNHYTLIFGHRRLLACQKLGWDTITAQINHNIDAEKMMVLNLTENIQRNQPSFAELGRGIGKLVKMGLNYAEVGARLGIPEKRVKDIVHAYDNIPASIRAKVVFKGKGNGGKGKGGIAPQVATTIAKIKKTFGLSDKNCEELVKYVVDTEMSKDDIQNMAILLQAGLSVPEAIEKLHEYNVYHLTVVAPRLQVSHLMRESGIPNYNLFFRKIIYGEIKGIPKPSFIKL